MLLLEELKEQLAERFDEVTLLEMLGVNSQQLVERFSDIIENNAEYYENQLEQNSLDYGMLEEEINNDE